MPKPLLVRPDPSGPRTARARSHVVTGGPQPCAQAQASAPTQNAYTDDEIASLPEMSRRVMARLSSMGERVQRV